MDKQQLKQKLLEAVRSEPHIDDIKSVALFGSYLTGEAKETSDIDVLIDFKPEARVGFFKLADIKHHFEECIGRAIDLVTPDALSKYIRGEVLSQAESIYEK